MIWFVAVIAVLNIGVGYALAVYLGAAGGRQASTRSEIRSQSTDATDEYDESYDGDDMDADGYEDDIESEEYENAAV